MTTFGDQLRSLAAQIDTASNLTGEVRKPIPMTGSAKDEYAKMVWLPDDTLAVDFWVVGLVGAARGCHNKHWAEAMLSYGIMSNADVPKHLAIVTAVPKELPWFNALASAADCGWIDGSAYSPVPEEGRLARWRAAGCPSRNGNGVYGNDGSLINPQAWATVWQGLANARG